MCGLIKKITSSKVAFLWMILECCGLFAENAVFSPYLIKRTCFCKIKKESYRYW